MSRLLTIDEASEYLGISKLTLYGWVSARKLGFVKVGRLVKFKQQDLEKWIDQHTVKARIETQKILYSIPCQLNNLSEPLPQLVGKEQNWAKMRLRCLVESRPFLLSQYPVALVLRVRHRHLSRRIALQKPTSDSNIKAVLQGSVVIVYSLQAGGFAILPDSLGAVNFNVLRLDLAHNLSTKERHQLTHDSFHAVAISA